MTTTVVQTLTTAAEAALQAALTQVIAGLESQGEILVQTVAPEIEAGLQSFLSNAATEVGQALASLWAKVSTLLPVTQQAPTSAPTA